MPEEEAFCVFVKLMQDYRLRELFKPSMAELGLCMYQFECMIQVDTSYLVVRLPQGVMRVCQNVVMHSGNAVNPYDFRLAGATPGAAFAFPGSELSHFHVCLLLVPHHLPHLLPSARRHKNLWHLYVWGQLKGTVVVLRSYHLPLSPHSLEEILSGLLLWLLHFFFFLLSLVSNVCGVIVEHYPAAVLAVCHCG